MDEQTSKMWSCCSSANENNGKRLLECSICEKMFHCDCLAIDPPSDPSMWICSSCNLQTPDAKNADNTQVYFKSNVTTRANKRQALQSPPDIASFPVAEERVRSIIEEVMQLQLDRLLEKMNLNIKILLNKEINSLREEVTELRKSVDFMSNQYDDIVKEKKGIEDQVKALQTLHAATRIKAKEKGYKFVWIRGGRIFLRKTDDADVKVIRDMDSLDLFV
ncbi:hypothetical protein PYW08_013063 [Mythimna loreyi]|uniref:Uncharacterized protein n=1 Tax=Mythimna loreyi TaxID=667449 RepID=A0ACC2Q413_9NEOP|nr:hypothetical protein PYW08_013063 [Mythimna loreyi]